MARNPNYRPALQTALVAAAVAGLIVAAFLLRARQLTSDPYPLGVDGYYYVVQVRSLLESGQLNYPAAPLAFWWLWPWAAIFGPVLGVKLGAAAGTALAVWPAYLLARRVSGSRAAALLGATLVATSASSQFLAGEFLKQGLGLTLALAALAALAAALDRPGRARTGLAAVLVLGTLLVHKSSFALVLLVGAPAGWWQLRARDERLALRALAGLGALVVVVAGLGVLAPGRFPGPRDLVLAADLFSAQAEWDLPALVLPRFRLELGHDALLAALLGLAALATGLHPRLRGAGPRLPPLALGFVAFALLVGLPWLEVHDPQGAAFRLRAAAFVALAPLAALVAVRVLALFERAESGVTALVCLGAATGLVYARPFDSAEGQSHTHPALVLAVRALDGTLPPGAQVVTQDRKVAFMARWYARQPMRLHPDAVPDGAGARYRLLPRNWITADLHAALGELRRAPPPGVAPPRDLHPFDDDGLVLVTEATFVYLMSRVSPATRAYYQRWPTT